MSCKTKQEYIDNGFFFIERPNGTVDMYDQNNQPVSEHQNESCCNNIGYSFDINAQKCLWSTLTNVVIQSTNNTRISEDFKIVLFPQLNNTKTFVVEENENACLNVSFDFLFYLTPEDIIKAYSNYNYNSFSEVIEDIKFNLTIEKVNKDTNRLETIYEKELFFIEEGLINYILAKDINSGIFITKEILYDDLTNTLFNELLNSYETQFGELEDTNILKSWYSSPWLNYSEEICDEEIINKIKNEDITITIKAIDNKIDFKLLIDRVRLNKNGELIDNELRFISEPPRFKLKKVIDNKKSWVTYNSFNFRQYDLKQRETEYSVNDSRLIINTKEIDLNLSPSNAIEYDLWYYTNDNECLIDGLNNNEYETFSCPSGYTLSNDGESCISIGYDTPTLSGSTFNVYYPYEFTRFEHFNHRGTIFTEDITNMEWPIKWESTPNNSWIGPYYNTSYLSDSNGNYIKHTGFGEKKYTDGTLIYSSPKAFSGLLSEFGDSGEDFIGNKPNPNILWGGTKQLLTGTTFNDVTSSQYSGRLINGGIWTDNVTDSLNQWVGVSHCLNLTETKTYRIGFSGDQNIRVKINGRILFNPDLASDDTLPLNDSFQTNRSRVLQSYLVVGVTLQSGLNIIEIEGYHLNELRSAGFVLEIYDASDEVLKNIRKESELSSVTVFSTRDLVTNEMVLGDENGYSCPTGFSLFTCSGSPYQCVSILRTIRSDEQVNNCCAKSPILVKNYENKTTELSLVYSSGVTFTSTTLENLYIDLTGLTTTHLIDNLYCGQTMAIGLESGNTFNGYWFTSENDSTLGLYEVVWVSGISESYENISNQLTSESCSIINNIIEFDALKNNQGINRFTLVEWDSNRKKCTYNRCGDDGCININNLLTTELNNINTLEEMREIFYSELIDVKNRQTISTYPTLKLLFERYNSHSLEYCENESSKFDYFDMISFMDSIGDYWIDLVEQILPATTIWNSTHIYKNTIFDQQKYKYKNVTIFPVNDNTVTNPLKGDLITSNVDLKIELLPKTIIDINGSKTMTQTIITDSVGLGIHKLNVTPYHIGSIIEIDNNSSIINNNDNFIGETI
jgi:hypothetical protein